MAGPMTRKARKGHRGEPRVIDIPQAKPYAAPPPVAAARVPGDTELWNAAFWLLRRGAYGVEIRVEGARGAGAVAVPLQAAALARPIMPPALGAGLIALGALLLAFARRALNRGRP